MKISQKKFLIIFGPPAVGKMTVAYEVAKMTGFKVFHNHMTIELLLPFFDFGSPAFNRLNERFRMEIFQEVAQSEVNGFIFTFTWALGLDSEKQYVDRIIALFEKHGWENHFIELEASLEERIKRNKSEFRLSQKASKRNVKESEQRLIRNSSKYRMNSNDDFFYQDESLYLKLITTQQSANNTANAIVEHFKLLSSLGND